MLSEVSDDARGVWNILKSNMLDLTRGKNKFNQMCRTVLRMLNIHKDKNHEKKHKFYKTIPYPQLYAALKYGPWPKIDQIEASKNCGVV